MEFLIVFGVLVSFSEQQGEILDDREKNIDNLVGRNELIEMKEYTQDYILQNEWVTNMYLDSKRWEQDNDSIFLVYDEKRTSIILHGIYTNRDPFNPPRVVYDAIKLDGTFRFLGSISGGWSHNYDGTDLKYLMINTDKKRKPMLRNLRKITSMGVWLR